MSDEIKIYFDGDVPGLDSGGGKMSVGSFFKPVSLLLEALQQEIGHMTGISGHGKDLDLLVTDMEGGCLLLHLTPVTPSFNLPAGIGEDKVIQEASIRVFQNIERGAGGGQTTPRIRQYLDSLPKGVNAQKYSVHRDGQEVYATKTIKKIEIVETKTLVRSSMKFKGILAAAQFQKDKLTFLPNGATKSITAAADSSIVTQALSLREQQIHVLLVRKPNSKTMKVVWIKEYLDNPLNEKIDKIISDRWSDDLKRIAE